MDNTKDKEQQPYNPSLSECINSQPIFIRILLYLFFIVSLLHFTLICMVCRDIVREWNIQKHALVQPK